jgi:hypothetical protein
MAEILEQNAIDKLLKLNEELEAKKAIADSAKEKIREMYIDTCGYRCFEDMDTLVSIGSVIKDIAELIHRDSIYFPSFMMLKQSYENKILKV